MTTEITSLTIQARAAIALGSSKAEAELTELAGKSKSIVAITNDGGRNECHRAAMVAKEARINIEKAGKSAREDATAFSKAVITEEARLVGLIKPEENRLLAIRDEWDAQVKAEKEAAAALERQRIADIKARIANFADIVTEAAMLASHGAEQNLEAMLAVEIDDRYGEFYGEAVEAKAIAVARLREIVAAKTAAEELAAKAKAEQEAEAARLAAEAQRLAAERAEMDRIAAENRAAEAKRQADERIRLDAERAELARQRKELDDAKAADAKARSDAQAAAVKAEVERISALPPIELVAQVSDVYLASEAGATVSVEENQKSETQAPLTVTGATQTAPYSTSKTQNSDMKRLQFRSELIARIDAMSAVQMANLIAYLDAQAVRERIAA